MATISGFSDYYESKVIDHMLRGQAFVVPASIYIALYTTMPQDDGTGGVEVAGGNYTRKAVTLNPAVAGVATNNGDILFNVATAPWGLIVGFGIFDLVAAGNLLMGNTMTNKTIDTDDQLKIPDTYLTVTVS